MKQENSLLKTQIEKLTLQEIRKQVSPKYSCYFEDLIFEQWIASKLADRDGWMSPSSFEKYVQIIGDFCTYWGGKPRDIVQSWRNIPYEKREQQREDVWRPKFERWFLLMKGEVTARDRNETSVRPISHNVAVRSYVIANEFLELNNIFLHAKKFRSLPRRDEKGEILQPYVPSAEVIRRAVQTAESWGDSALKEYILIGKDCGLSIGDLLSYDPGTGYYDPVQKMKYLTVREQYINGKCPIYILGKRKKTGVPYVGFLGEESIERLMLRNNRIVGFDSKRTVQDRFEKLAKELNEPRFVPKALRAFTASATRPKEMNEQVAKILSGHRVSDIEKFYVWFHPDELAKTYRSIYDRLRIFSACKEANE